jgi:3-dehydroquinate synthase
MKTVEVNTSHKYSVVISSGILPKAGEWFRRVAAPCNVCIVTDDHVDGLYSLQAEKSIKDAGFSVKKFVFSHGEQHKTMATIAELLEFLALNGFDRNDLIVALGGGITGDLAGFAAACYMRGIRFVQIPTTLLAAVDSSVGGKTGVNLAAGKNLAGAFWQPQLVLCDPQTFQTLPEAVFSDGIAEAIKCAVLKDPELFEILESKTFDVQEVIRRCVFIKASIVEEDEKETGVRALLNFGHTVAHAVEKCSGYAISHGKAVAIGMAVVSKGAEKQNITDGEFVDRLTDLLKLHKLPVQCDCSTELVLEKLVSDKKRRGNEITLVLPKKIGECILKTMAVTDAVDLIRKGLE